MLLLHLGREDEAYNLIMFLIKDYPEKKDHEISYVIQQKNWLDLLPTHDKNEFIYEMVNPDVTLNSPAFKEENGVNIPTPQLFYPDNLFYASVIAIKFSIVNNLEQVKEDLEGQNQSCPHFLEHVKKRLAQNDILDKYLDFLFKRSPNMLKSLADPKRLKKSPIEKGLFHPMDFGFNLFSYNNFKPYGKCFFYHFEKLPGAQAKIADFLNKQPGTAPGNDPTNTNQIFMNVI